jgi:hypothetical protein
LTKISSQQKKCPSCSIQLKFEDISEIPKNFALIEILQLEKPLVEEIQEMIEDAFKKEVSNQFEN